MDDDLVQDLDGLRRPLDPLESEQLNCRHVSEEERGQGADGHPHGVSGLPVGDGRLPVVEVDVEPAVVPVEEVVLYLEPEADVLLRGVAAVSHEECLHIHDPPHDVRLDRLGDVAVLQVERQQFVLIGVATDLVYHGVVGADVVPKTLLGLPVEVDHLLDVHHILLDQVDHVSEGLPLLAVVHRDGGVIGVPSPVLLPGGGVPQEASVRAQGEGDKGTMTLDSFVSLVRETVAGEIQKING